MTTAKLEELSAIAKNASEIGGKTWHSEEGNDGSAIYGEIENPALSNSSRKHSRIPETICIDICRTTPESNEDAVSQAIDPIAEYITTFSPKTVLDLIKRLETAEEKLSKIEAIANKAFSKSLHPSNPLKDNKELLKISEKILDELGMLPSAHKLLTIRKDNL